MTPEDRNRGERARQLLEDPVLLEALAAMRDDVDAAMLTPVALDPAAAVRLIHARQAIADFTAKLHTFVQVGTEPEPARRGFA